MAEHPTGTRLVAFVLVGVLTLSAAACGSSKVTAPPVRTTTAAPDLIAVSAQPTASSPPATTPAGGGPPSPDGPSTVLQLLSASTGQVVEANLATDSGGLSLAPDGSAVYYEVAGERSDPFQIDRVSTHGGPSVPVASGEDPTVSPDSAHLAYATGSGHAIAVQDLHNHHTRTIELNGLIGPGASFLTTPGYLTWLSDTELVAIPPADGEAFVGSTTTSTTTAAPAGTCTRVYQQGKQCALVIDLTAATPAHLIVLPLPRLSDITALGAGPDPATLLVGSSGTVSRLALSGTTATDQADLTIPDRVLVEGFSPDGRQVLYLRGHGPIQLWAGTVNSTSVSPGRELLPNAALSRIAW